MERVRKSFCIFDLFPNGAIVLSASCISLLLPLAPFYLTKANFVTPPSPFFITHEKYSVAKAHHLMLFIILETDSRKIIITLIWEMIREYN